MTSRRSLATLLGASLVVLAAASPAIALPGMGQRDAGTDTVNTRPDYLQDAGIEQRVGAPLPADLVFRDETGSEVRLGDLLGERPVVLAPVYYGCPMLCPLFLDGLAKSLKVVGLEPGEDYDLVAYSFAPGETPEQAARAKAQTLAALGKPGAAPYARFLVGDEATVARMNEAIGFRTAPDESTGEIIHAAATLLVTPEGQVSRYLYGVDPLPRSLRLGLVEASANEVGTALDQVLLYCYRYDPATGKYTLLTLRLLRIGAVATVLGIGLLVAFLLREERAGRRSRRMSEGMA